MPPFLIVLFIGVVLLCASYYLDMPPEVKSLCKFGGVVCLIAGAFWAVWVLLLAGLM